MTITFHINGRVDPIWNPKQVDGFHRGENIFGLCDRDYQMISRHHFFFLGKPQILCLFSIYSKFKAFSTGFCWKKRKKGKEKKNIMGDHLDVFVNKIRKTKSDSSRRLRRIPFLSGVIQVDWKGNKNKIKERPLAIKTKKCFFV